MVFMGRIVIHSFVLVFFCAVPLLCVYIFKLLAVTTLRVHPAETRLTVYRRPYILANILAGIVFELVSILVLARFAVWIIRFPYSGGALWFLVSFEYLLFSATAKII